MDGLNCCRVLRTRPEEQKRRGSLDTGSAIDPSIGCRSSTLAGPPSRELELREGESAGFAGHEGPCKCRGSSGIIAAQKSRQSIYAAAAIPLGSCALSKLKKATTLIETAKRDADLVASSRSRPCSVERALGLSLSPTWSADRLIVTIGRANLLLIKRNHPLVDE